MTSPDFREWVDLTVLDTTVPQLIETAMASAPTKFPGWVPHETDIASLLIETFAEIVDPFTYAANRVPSAVLLGVLAGMGATLDPGYAPTCSITVTAADELGHILPAGSQFALALNGPLPSQLVFQTVSDGTIPTGSTTCTVTAVATSNTSTANGVPANWPLAVIAPQQWIERAVTATTVTAGAEPETTPSFMTRASQRLRRVTASWILPDQFDARALEWPAVVRARSFDPWDPTSGNPVGVDLGHIGVIVSGSNATDIGSTQRDALRDALAAGTSASLSVHVVPARPVDVDITIEVLKRGAYTDTEVRTDIAQRLGDWLDPDTWQWGQAILPGEVFGQVDRCTTVETCRVVAEPSADIVLEADQLPRLGTLTVTFS